MTTFHGLDSAQSATREARCHDARVHARHGHGQLGPARPRRGRFHGSSNTDRRNSSITLAELRFGADAKRSRRLPPPPHRDVRLGGQCHAHSIKGLRPLQYRRKRIARKGKPSRNLRHPHRGACPVVRRDLGDEQHQALHSHHGIQARELGLIQGSPRRILRWFRRYPRLTPKGCSCP